MVNGVNRERKLMLARRIKVVPCFIWLSIIILIISTSPAFSDKQVMSNTKNKPVKSSVPKLNKAEKLIMQKIGAKLTEDQNLELDDIIINRRTKEITFPAKINMWEGPLEVLICTKKEGRLHESLLFTEIEPFKLQLMLILSGAKNGARNKSFDEKGIPQGTLFDIDVKPDHGKRVPIENWLYNVVTKKQKERVGWVFVGSSFRDGKCLANVEGNIALTWSFGNTILDNPSVTGDTDDYFGAYTERIEKVNENYRKFEKDGDVFIPVTVYLYRHKPSANTQKK